MENISYLTAYTNRKAIKMNMNPTIKYLKILNKYGLGSKESIKYKRKHSNIEFRRRTKILERLFLYKNDIF